MKMITAELVVDEAKRDTKGRRITPKARREELLAAYEQSGLTQAGFARREGIKYNTFTSWIYERRTRGTQGAACRAGDPPVRFAEVGMAAVAGRGPQVEAGVLSVTLPDGLVVRGAEAASLAALVKALRS